jgi:ribosomal protein S18 acetylase RimI-like enzyme
MMNQSIPIRTATQEDVQRLAEILMALLREHHEADPQTYDFFLPHPELVDPARCLAGELRKPECLIFVTEDESGAVAGLAKLRIATGKDDGLTLTDATVRLGYLAVHPQSRGKGHGTALLKAVEDAAIKANASQVRLDVWTFNERARKFYERAGFQTLSVEMAIRPRHSIGHQGT